MENIIATRSKDLPSDLYAIAVEAANLTAYAVRRAAAHLQDPQKFTKPGVNTLENAALEVLKLRRPLKPRQFRAFALRSITQLNSNELPRLSSTNSVVLPRLTKLPVFQSQGVLSSLRNLPVKDKALKLDVGTVQALERFVPKGDIENLLNALSISYSIIPGSNESAEPAANPPAPAFTKLVLYIDRVRCVDDVGWELTDWIEDDIHLGGLGVDSTGQERKIQAFKVGDFKKGEVRNFQPSRKFVEFDLTRPGDWPRAFSTTFLMAESDGSGAFLDALHTLWSLTHTIVEELVTASIVAAATGIGVAVGAAGGPVGMLIGAVVGVALGLIFSLITASLEDDVFESCTITLGLPNAQTRFPNRKRKSGKRTEQLTHPSAQYLVRYEWELVR